MKFQKRWYSLVLTACCFCLILVMFSSTAFAADAGGAITFAEAYGVEIEDEGYVEITFEFPGITKMILVYKNDSMEDVAISLNKKSAPFGYAVTYDKASGHLIVKDSDQQIVEFKVLLDDKELTLKPPASGPINPTTPAAPPTMSELLATISAVFTAAMGWMSMVADKVVSNPILLIVVILGFLSTGILLFKRFLNL